MPSEKPYIKSENVILRILWFGLEERTRSIQKKKKRKMSQSSILRRGMTFQTAKLQKGSFEKIVKSFSFMTYRK